MQGMCKRGMYALLCLATDDQFSTVDTSESCFGPKQPRLYNGASDSQGAQGMRGVSSLLYVHVHTWQAIC